ncbi:hypothetical protein BDP27DRAFT_1378283 [Rhodocollybia butyracea]|uniref:Uncharacterized protein n=1 Tax=Rhodocollybia butyracea TaxID=206335 RepID=A0A9P5P0S5_9AGAR|nr:hypothetical protein BDP27DRAFT_1378283 [Rhodocollybia butyracea]
MKGRLASSVRSPLDSRACHLVGSPGVIASEMRVWSALARLVPCFQMLIRSMVGRLCEEAESPTKWHESTRLPSLLHARIRFHNWVSNAIPSIGPLKPSTATAWIQTALTGQSKFTERQGWSARAVGAVLCTLISEAPFRLFEHVRQTRESPCISDDSLNSDWRVN